MLPLIRAVLAFAVFTRVFALNATDKYCRTFDTAIGSKVECTYRHGQFMRAVPPNFTNMIMTIISPSGGAALSPENILNANTRGKGVKIVLKISDNIPKTGIFSLRSYVNGESASLDRSGRNRLNLPRTAGSGGACPNNTINRYAGAGGERSKILFWANAKDTKSDPDSQLHIGGGGGAGGYLNGTLSNGGNGALIDRYHNLAMEVPEGHEADVDVIRTARWIVSSGGSGFPDRLSGQGGGIYFADESLLVGGTAGQGHTVQSAAIEFSQGNGEPGFEALKENGKNFYVESGHGGSLTRSEGLTACLAGGGGGDGWYKGGGGGAFAIYGSTQPAAAGSGGGGSSELVDVNLEMYEIVHQENVYDPNPRIIFTFDIPAAHMVSVSAGLKGENKGKLK